MFFEKFEYNTMVIIGIVNLKRLKIGNSSLINKAKYNKI